MNCQICGKVLAGYGQSYQGYPQAGGFCTCQTPQRGYMESDSSHRQIVSLAAITVELFNQRAMLQEILALLKNPK